MKIVDFPRPMSLVPPPSKLHAERVASALAKASRFEDMTQVEARALANELEDCREAMKLAAARIEEWVIENERTHAQLVALAKGK